MITVFFFYFNGVIGYPDMPPLCQFHGQRGLPYATVPFHEDTPAKHIQKDPMHKDDLIYFLS